jgi:hypothetical protein
MTYHIVTGTGKGGESIWGKPFKVSATCVNDSVLQYCIVMIANAVSAQNDVCIEQELPIIGVLFARNAAATAE